MTTYITIVLLIWFATLVNRGSFRRTLPLSYRVQNICLSFLLLFFASFDIYSFWWSVLHPSFLQQYFMPTSFFSPPVTFVIVGLSVCGAHLEWVISHWMARQKKQARNLAASFAPYLCALTVVRAIQSCEGRHHVAFGLIVITLFSVVLYGWLYLFCRSRQTEQFMTNVA
jgi:hypothetical protein